MLFRRGKQKQQRTAEANHKMRAITFTERHGN